MAWLSNERHLFGVAVILYGLCLLHSLFLWREEFRHQDRINYWICAAGFLFHTLAMLKRGISFSRCPVNNIYEAMVFIDWTIVATYLAIGLWSRLAFLGAFASPIIFGLGVFALMPGLDPPTKNGPVFTNALASLHAALILLSYGAFGLSSVAGLMYLTQEHDLRFHKFRAVFSKLPPIQRLESVVGRCLVAGFALLTAGLAIGGYYFHSLKPEPPRLLSDPKVLWSIFVWFLYLGLLVKRWFFSQGGRRFAWGAVVSFLFILLTFWGFNLISTIHHASALKGAAPDLKAR